jgi:hypothetical protein
MQIPPDEHRLFTTLSRPVGHVPALEFQRRSMISPAEQSASENAEKAVFQNRIP